MFYPEHSATIRGLVGALKGQKVAIMGHSRPDGDCIGSQVALCRILRSHGADAECVNADAVPRRLAFLVDDTPFLGPQEMGNGDFFAISVDCADHARVGETLRARFPCMEINIDHHISNTLYGRHNIVDSGSSATAELLAGMFFDNKWAIDRVTAQALYVGIATDTGQFRFPSTTRRTFSLAGFLLDCGADPAAASFELYERESIGKMRLLQRFLSSLKTECDGRACVGFISRHAFEETGSSPEDTEGLVDYARSIDGVEIAALLEERNGGVKVNLRCKDAIYRVDKIALEIGGGGGHPCAAGFNVSESLNELYPRFIESLRRQFRAVDDMKA